MSTKMFTTKILDLNKLFLIPLLIIGFVKHVLSAGGRGGAIATKG